ncbi:type-1 angiotensin II receptor-like [Carassius carassius]|uniref:type-1 angiotensin II receptor-like n=1 Tax=Carassius carassius TaxID=217509 RepID=UPI0028691E09|nr:type-1 angiotensin II receptor-like [Carassius carassius]XP_059419699.1 type-1 angiotensin II receptor-like [Carassius carassius]
MDNITADANVGLKLKCNMTGHHNFIFTFIPVVYSCNFIIGIVGNSLVVAVIYYCLKLKTIANIFVLNLAVSDLTFLLTLPIWAINTATGYHWLFGDFLCKAIAGMILLNLYTSIFFLTALAIDRYLAIVHPVKSRRSRTVVYARVTCILVWVVAFLLSLPTAVIRRTHFIQHNNVTVCGILDGDLGNVLAALSLMKSVLGFLLPITIILTCYCLIGRSLLKARDIQRNSRSKEDEVLSMLAAAVLSFFLCWTPHQIFNFMNMLVQLTVITNCDVIDIIDTVMPFTICIAFFNSCMNPILYGFVGQNFRRNLLKLLRCSSTAVASHPTLSTKMSTLSYQASESFHLSVHKPSSLPQAT